MKSLYSLTSSAFFKILTETNEFKHLGSSKYPAVVYVGDLNTHSESSDDDVWCMEDSRRSHRHKDLKFFYSMYQRWCVGGGGCGGSGGDGGSSGGNGGAFQLPVIQSGKNQITIVRTETTARYLIRCH